MVGEFSGVGMMGIVDNTVHWETVNSRKDQ